jgi:hypothetical protein
MGVQIRRIVTGHDASGKAIVKTDEQVTAVPRIAAGISGCEIWSTDRMPIDNSAAADAAQRTGFVAQYNQYNYVGTGGGTTFRINEFSPGCARFTHRTETMDYALQLSGELDCELDGGEVVHLTPGDVIVQRGTIHVGQ